MNSQYLDRYASYLADSEQPYAMVRGHIFQRYGRMITPVGPVQCDFTITAAEARMLLRRLGGVLVRWTTGPAEPGVTLEWYAVVCRFFTDVAVLKSKARSEISRGLRQCGVEQVDAEYIGRHGYEVFRRAAARYGGSADALPTREEYEGGLHRTRGYGDLFQYFGVFCDGQLAGYSKVNRFGTTEANYAVMKFDPAYLKSYTSYALVYRMNEYYLGGGLVGYVNDGFRSLLHETGVQRYLIQKFGFTKLYTRPGLVYAAPYGLIVRATYPLRRIGRLLDRRLGALYELERMRRASV